MTSRRSRLFESLHDVVQASGNVALHSAHGFGKSYMMEALSRVLTEEAESHVVQVDLSTFSTGRDALVLVADRLMSESVDLTDSAVSLHDAWRLISTAISETDRPIRILLDEFDSVVTFPDGGEFLRHLRELIHRSVHTQTSAVLSSRRPLPYIEEDVAGVSTLAGICASYFIPVVESGDLDVWWPLDDAGPPRNLYGVPAWTCGIPSLISLSRSNNELDLDEDLALAQQTAELERFLDYLEKLGLLATAVHCVLEMRAPTLGRQRSLLVSMGVIAPSVGVGSVLADMPAFISALEFRALSMEPWSQVEEAVRRVRSFVDAVLVESDGLDWHEAIVGPPPPDIPSLGRAIPSALGKADFNWLLDASLYDIWLVIRTRWPDFRPFMGAHSQAYWQVSFEALMHVSGGRDPKVTSRSLRMDASEAAARFRELIEVSAGPDDQILQDARTGDSLTTIIVEHGGTLMIQNDGNYVNSDSIGAIVGGHGSVSGGQFQGKGEISIQSPGIPCFDEAFLAELREVRSALRKEAETLEQDAAVVEVGRAQAAIEAGNVGDAEFILARAGSWVGDIASKIGAELIVKALGG